MEILKQIDYETWVRIAFIALYILSWVSQLIASKVKNSRLKQMFSVLPDAMEKAEVAGHNSSEKLQIAVEYIQAEVKHLSRSTIVQAIEDAIKISKTVNARQEQVSSESRSTR